MVDPSSYNIVWLTPGLPKGGALLELEFRTPAILGAH